MRVTISRIEQDGKITFQENAGIAIVTIHRPRFKNAMSKNMWLELARIGKEIPRTPKTKVVLVRGAGGQFSAGSDLKEFSRMTIDESNAAFDAMEEAISTFENLELPTIGLIDGPALGAGFQLALACDIRLGTSSVKMGMPIGRLGITLSHQFVKRMTDLIGASKAKDLVYTGRLLDVNAASEWGLINYVIPDDEDPEHYALLKADLIKKQSPASLRAVKEKTAVLVSSSDISLPSSGESNVDPHDFPEGVQSFIEKSKPNFRK